MFSIKKYLILAISPIFFLSTAATALKILNEDQGQDFLWIQVYATGIADNTTTCWEHSTNRELFAMDVPRGEEVEIGGVAMTDASKSKYLCLTTAVRGLSNWKGASVRLKNVPECEVTVYSSYDGGIIPSASCK